MRTSDAYNWTPDEDEFLCRSIKEGIRLGIPMNKVYQQVAILYEHMTVFTDRSPNACRQRWGKIHNDESLEFSDEESSVNSEVSVIATRMPVTTGIQFEINFEEGILMEMTPENKLTLVPELTAHDLGFDHIRSVLNTMEEDQSSLLQENEKLFSELTKANDIIDSLRKELSTFNQVKALLKVSV
jgi:hypothetical protein